MLHPGRTDVDLQTDNCVQDGKGAWTTTPLEKHSAVNLHLGLHSAVDLHLGRRQGVHKWR